MGRPREKRDLARDHVRAGSPREALPDAAAFPVIERSFEPVPDLAARLRHIYSLLLDYPPDPE